MSSRLLAAFALFVAGCTELPPITEGQCGNGIIEKDEDCDSSMGQCKQCVFTCADDQVCPVGYTCGVDAVCAAPGATFLDAIASVPFPVRGYRVVHVDEDGYGDVVGINETALLTRYGDPRAALATSSIVVTPPLQGAPSLTHLDGDGVKDDLVIPVIDGLVAYTGAFGLPSPRQFPFNTTGDGMGPGGRPNPSDVIQIDKTIAMVGARSADNAGLTFAVVQLTGFGLAFDAEISELCGQTYPAAGLVDKGSATYRTATTTFVTIQPDTDTLCVIAVTPQEELRGPSSVSCPNDPDAFMQSPKCVYTITTVGALPATSRPPVFADLDGDGCPSLLDGDGGANAVIEHRGTMSGSTCSISAADVPVPALGQPPGSELIGAMRLDPAGANLRPDALITTYGIIGLSTAPTPVPKQLYISDRPVDYAEVGDLNSDGELDVVLTSDFPNVDVVRRVPGSDQFLLTRMSTTGVIVYTIIGDFDGDTRMDLAYAERLGDEEQLSISYGVPGGVLPGVPVDAFKRLIFLAVMEVSDSADPFSIVDDLIAIDMERATDPPEITILHGSSNRTMLSFFGSPVPEPGTVFRGVAAGHFVESAQSVGLVDLFAFQTREHEITGEHSTTMHVIPGLPNGRFGDQLYFSGPPTFSLPATDEVGLCAAMPAPAFCLNNASFAAVPGPDGHDILFGIDTKPDFSEPAIARFDPAATDILVAVREKFFPSGGRLSLVEPVDVDFDGRMEIVASFTSSPPSSPNGGRGYTRICDVTDDYQIGTCADVATDILGDPALECVAFARGRLTPPCEAVAGDHDLAVLCRTEDSSFVEHIRGEGNNRYSVHRRLMSQPNRRFEDIKLGDVTGDGLDDLVVLAIDARIPQLEVYPQAKSRESNVCVPAR